MTTLIGLLIGSFAAFCTFAILFTHRTQELFPAAYLPLILAVVTSFTLAWVNPKKWLWLAFCVALPTIIVSALVLSGLVAEDHMDWGWIVIMGGAVVVCVVPSWLGTRMKLLIALMMLGLAFGSAL